jgi:ABC-type branched-subunit amino acid transport system permease subunit
VKSRGAWLVAIVTAAAMPYVVTVPYYLSLAITALLYITLAVAYDLVVGRIGALSLGQPVFLGFGAYVGALVSVHWSSDLLLEIAIAALGAVLLATLVGLPSFRLSDWTFAIGTLGFTLGAQLVAQNWTDVTGGQLCISRIPDATVGAPGLSVALDSLVAQYYVILGIAIAALFIVSFVTRARLGLSFLAVGDDIVLAAARGVSPMATRITAFAISAAITSTAGVFMAHFQTVICPSVISSSYTVSLLIMVFVGGLGSIRGITTAAIVFTVIPQLLQVADEWRLVIFGFILLIAILAAPGGIEQGFRAIEQLARGPRLTRKVPRERAS